MVKFKFQIVGFIWGYLCEDFAQTVYIIGAGLALAGLVCVHNYVTIGFLHVFFFWFFFLVFSWYFRHGRFIGGIHYHGNQLTTAHQPPKNQVKQAGKENPRIRLYYYHYFFCYATDIQYSQ